MNSESMSASANQTSTFNLAARTTLAKWFYAVLSVAVLLVLAGATPSAPGQTLTALYSFQEGANGYDPTAGLIRDAAGNLYGTTIRGGDLTCDSGFGCGTVFKLDPSGNLTVLHRFTGGADGAFPNAGVIRDAATGNLFGTATAGGDLPCYPGTGCGTVYKLSATGRFSVLHTFTGPDGVDPLGTLVHDPQGALYGTTVNGGAFDFGTVYKLDKTGKQTVLHSFSGRADGKTPLSGVIRDAAGNLFGTTYDNIGRIYGTVFKLEPTGKLTELHGFTGFADGAYPFASLVPSGEDLYGTTSGGGTYQYGTIFNLDKAGKETVLYTFTRGADGAYPAAGLIPDAA
jgi:uncharacterized repeat protein (TIGR03803 family)